MQSSDANNLEDKQICSDCIGEDYLKNLVESDNVDEQCSYCRKVGSAISIRELSGHVKRAFERHYSRTASDPDPFQYAMWQDKDIQYEWERDGDPTVYAIADAAEISNEIAEDIQKLLEEEHYDRDEAIMGEEGEFNSEAYYKKIMPEDHKWQKDWELFKKIIRTESRFFNGTCISQLRELFDTMDKMITNERKPLIVKAGPQTDYNELYRARVFQDGKKMVKAMNRPDKRLGAPPSRYASPGRMNASGISVFYGADSVSTALAEVRPPVGSYVATARFKIIRPIKLLDLRALGVVHETGSVFDPNYAHRLGRMIFLHKLTRRIIQPVMPDDQEVEHLSTQAIADFLATESSLHLDGILFPSVQAGDGLNVVLFHKASRCKEIDIPEGVKFDISTYNMFEDFTEPEFTVIEWVPLEEESFVKKVSNHDNREETLSVDIESVRGNRITNVKVGSNECKVSRIRAFKDES